MRLSTDAGMPEETPARPGWYAGDLHAHSGHSDGRITTAGVRVGAPPSRVFDAARAAGLEFVALTDHNTVSHWLDVDRLQPAYAPLLLLHGREVTTYRGHANAIGERRFHDFRLPAPGASPAAVLTEVASDGAFISINHPSLPDDERCMGCGWNDTDADTLRHVHGVEVVNGEPGDMAAWRFWASQLNRGVRLAVVGGSDEHTPDEARDRVIGRPATVVYADALSETAIVAGLRAGRTYVRVEGPAGPVLDITAEQGGRRVGLGDVLSPGETVFRARVSGATDVTLEWIRNGEVARTEVLPPSGTTTYPCRLGPREWVSVIVRDTSGRPLAITSAIYTSHR